MTGGPVDVPDVVGFDVSDACEMLWAAELVPYGPEMAPAPTTGTVVAQEPAAGASAEPAKPVMLWTHGMNAADALVGPSGEPGTAAPI